MLVFLCLCLEAMMYRVQLAKQKGNGPSLRESMDTTFFLVQLLFVWFTESEIGFEFQTKSCAKDE